MAVACEGQLLLLVQPANGPVPEPTVLGAVPTTDVLVDDATQASRRARFLFGRSQRRERERERERASTLLESRSGLPSGAGCCIWLEDQPQQPTADVFWHAK